MLGPVHERVGGPAQEHVLEGIPLTAVYEQGGEVAVLRHLGGRRFLLPFLGAEAGLDVGDVRQGVAQVVPVTGESAFVAAFIPSTGARASTTVSPGAACALLNAGQDVRVVDHGAGAGVVGPPRTQSDAVHRHGPVAAGGHGDRCPAGAGLGEIGTQAVSAVRDPDPSAVRLLLVGPVDVGPELGPPDPHHRGGGLHLETHLFEPEEPHGIEHGLAFDHAEDGGLLPLVHLCAVVVHAEAGLRRQAHHVLVGEPEPAAGLGQGVELVVLVHGIAFAPQKGLPRGPVEHHHGPFEGVDGPGHLEGAGGVRLPDAKVAHVLGEERRRHGGRAAARGPWMDGKKPQEQDRDQERNGQGCTVHGSPPPQTAGGRRERKGWVGGAWRSGP